MIRRVVVAALLLINFVSRSAAQQINDVRLDVSRPSIYLTFERSGENDLVWLRLHNNTRWAISVRTEDAYDGANVTPLTLSDGRQVSGLADDLEITPEYFVEHAIDQVTTSGRYWCTASTYWLPSARSVVFSFSSKELKEWEQLYIKFIYEWEMDLHPEHRVTFTEYQLQRIINSSPSRSARS
jgi:hypothetical protein